MWEGGGWRSGVSPLARGSCGRTGRGSQGFSVSVARPAGGCFRLLKPEWHPRSEGGGSCPPTGQRPLPPADLQGSLPLPASQAASSLPASCTPRGPQPSPQDDSRSPWTSRPLPPVPPAHLFCSLSPSLPRRPTVTWRLAWGSKCPSLQAPSMPAPWVLPPGCWTVLVPGTQSSPERHVLPLFLQQPF